MAGGNSYLDNLRLGQNVVLSNLAMGYSNGQFIAEKVFPTINVNAFPSLRVPEMNRDHLKIINDTRSLYGDPVQSKNGELAYTDLVLREHTQQKIIDIQELINMSIVDLRKIRTYALTESMALAIEKAVADSVQTYASYTNSNAVTLTGSDQWTHEDSAPATQMVVGIEKVRSLIGMYPNVAVMGANSWNALRKNTKMVKSIKGATGVGIVTKEQVAEHLGLDEIIVGDSIYDNSEDVSDAFAPVDLWSDNCILAYVTRKKAEQRDMYSPSFGYTFKHSQFNPLMKNWKTEDGLKEIIQGTMIWAEKMFNNACGYMIKDTNG